MTVVITVWSALAVLLPDGRAVEEEDEAEVERDDEEEGSCASAAPSADKATAARARENRILVLPGEACWVFGDIRPGGSRTLEWEWRIGEM